MLAFLDDDATSFEFKDQRDYELHIALEVTYEHLEVMIKEGDSAGIECRGISDHGFIDSIYFRDPNGYVIELTAKRPDHDAQMKAIGEPNSILKRWSADKMSKSLFINKD